MSLTARHLEANAIPTVILGSARDIVEYCGAPRFLFTDFPLGNPCGKPGDAAMQRDILERALRLFETATAPRTTVQTPYVWSADENWRERYMQVRDEDLPRLRRLGDERRAMRGRSRISGSATEDR